MRILGLAAVLAGALVMGPALADGHLTEEDKMAAENTIKIFLEKDPTLQELLDKSVGYAVYPSVGKGGFVIGGSHGRGVAYEGGMVIGGTKLTSVKIGLVAGVETYSQLNVFDTAEAWQTFKDSKFSASAEASGTAMKKGASTNASFRDGVAIFITDQDGIMGDVSVAGEKFSFEPM
jgi:lipid-binding SYLF domain-containing protein